MRFRFCVPGRNHAAFTDKCLQSLIAQKGKHDFVVDWVDDASEDGGRAHWLACRLLKIDHIQQHLASGHQATRNEHRVGGMKNLHDMAQRAHDDEVLVIVGGDDDIAPFTLDRLEQEYKDPNCWLTYGTYENSDGFPKVAERWHGADPRASKFVWAPLTVRAWLWKKMKEEDLQIGSGLWMPSSADVAFTLPLVEMAGVPRARYIEDVWYNRRVHPGNDHNTDSRLQTFCGWMACTKPRYSRLANRDETPTRTPHKLSWSILFSPRVQFGAPCDIE